MGELQKRGVKERRYVSRELIEKLSFFHIFAFWIFTVLAFGMIYFALASNPDNALLYRGELMESNEEGLINSLYYSFITVTTTGFGDIYPNGLTKIIAIIEVLFGVIIMAILISKLVGFKQEKILEEIHSINYEEAFTNYRRGLSLVRTDIVILMEKIENKTIKAREIKDLWIVFSGLDQTLTNLKSMIIPSKKDTHYNRKLELAKIELIMSSIKLTMHKVLELVKSLKHHSIEWRDELLLTSIYYEIQVIKDIIDYESKKSIDRKLIDKLNALRILIDDIEMELRPQAKPDMKPVESSLLPDKIDRKDHVPFLKEEEKPKTPPTSSMGDADQPQESFAEIQARLHSHIEILPPDEPHEKAADKSKEDFL